MEAQLKAALARAAQFKSITRDYTPAEIKEIGDLATEIEDLRGRINRNDGAMAALKGIAGSAHEPDDDDEDGDSLAAGLRIARQGAKGYATDLTRLDGPLVAKLASKMARYGHGDKSGTKALLPAGEVGESVQLQSESPVDQGKVASTFLDVLPVIKNPGSRFAYLQQTTRTNAAAPVAKGATKPTSTYELDRIEEDLVVVAHLSQPIDKFWLDDSPALAEFIGSELVYGLTRALEAQALSGSGTGANMKGLLTTSGVQNQAFVADAAGPSGSWLRTARAAITKLEAEGHAPAAFFVSPADWEAAETSRVSTGQLDLGNQPVDSAARRLWGVPTVVCQTLTSGQAALMGMGAAALNTDGRGVEIRWSENVGEDFSKNQIRARCEGRFQMSVYRPKGVVVIDTSAGA
jgi:HK97 family phage major capsid protein